MSDPNVPQDPFAAGPPPEQPSSSDQPTPPSAGQTPPAYGSQPPAYGAQPPAYGSQPPAYGAQPPAYGAQPPAYGAQPPAYGAQPPAYGTQPGGYYAQPAYAYPKNSLGVWSLVLGLVGIVLSCTFITGIPAIIVGNMAKRAVADGQANNGGMATAGIVLGWISTALGVLLIVIFTLIAVSGNWDYVDYSNF